MNSRLMLYSHDALGLGHVRRVLAIARAVLARRADLEALLVTCSPLVDQLPSPAGLDYIKLPSARKVDNLRYVSRTLKLDPAELLALRSQLLRGAVEGFEPDLLLVDKSPEGLMGELRGSLRLLERRTRPARCVLGWRDVLDEPGQVRAEWRTLNTLPLIERHYPEVWVYGDPRVFDLREEYGMPPPIASRVRYLGYLAPTPDPVATAAARAEAGAEDHALVVVTAGGGEDGEPLIAAWLEAAGRGLLPRGLRSVVVPGPFVPAESEARLRAAAPAGVQVRRFVPDLAPLLSAADAVVAMAGYNTVCEVLGAGVPAVLVPRVRPRREQWVRARRLAALGLCECLEPEGLDARALAAALARALERGRRPVTGCDLAGLARAAAAVERVLGPPAAAGARYDAAPRTRSGAPPCASSDAAPRTAIGGAR